MEKHVTSLELSKRLKALGVKQESEFYWICHEINLVKTWDIVTELPISDYPSKYWCSAFLASELGEKFDDWILEKTLTGYQCWWYGKKRRNLRLLSSSKIESIPMKEGKTQQDTLAFTLEYLIQNKLLKI